MSAEDSKFEQELRKLLVEFENDIKLVPKDSNTLEGQEASRKFAQNIVINNARKLCDQYAQEKCLESDGCPCLLVEPCSYACTCANITMSGGCMRCAKYGSKEQRIKAAERLASLSTKEGKWNTTGN